MTTINGDDGDNVLTGTDMAAGAITIVSTNTLGVQANDTSQNPVFSPDGTMVAFSSKADNLVAGDTNHDFDIFLKNLLTGEVTMVSTNVSGVGGNDRSLEPSFSPDGTKIAFSSWASNLVPGDSNGDRELFVKDLTNGQVTRVATDSGGS